MRAIGILGAALQLNDLYRTASDIFAPLMDAFYKDNPLNALESIHSDLLRGVFFDRCPAEAISTYPVNASAPEGECHAKFLGVCTGMELLTDALENMYQWATKANQAFPRNREKCAVLLTSKWDESEFDAYEQRFRYLALNDNHWFIFLLATKHGCIEIPFLPVEIHRLTRQTVEENTTWKSEQNSSSPRKNRSRSRGQRSQGV